MKIYRKTIRDKKLIELDDLEKGSWVHMVLPPEEAIDMLVNEIGLDRGLLSDSLDPYEVPRLEIEDDRIYVFASYAVEIEGRIATSPFTIIVGRQHIYTICIEECNFIEDIIHSPDVPSTTQKVKFIAFLFTKIIDSFNKSILVINKTVHKLGRQSGKITNKDVLKLVEYEETLNIFLSDLNPVSIYLNKLLSGKYLKLYEEDKELIEDVFLTASQVVDISNTTLKVISNTREAYSVIVANNLNQVMKLLTVMTVILTIPTIIASLFGMNVILPFEQNSNTFGYIILSVIITCSLLFYIFKKNDWI